MGVKKKKPWKFKIAVLSLSPREVIKPNKRSHFTGKDLARSRNEELVLYKHDCRPSALWATQGLLPAHGTTGAVALGPARHGGTVGWRGRRKSYAYALSLRCLSGSCPFELRVTDEPFIRQTRLGAAAPVPAPQVSTAKGRATLATCVRLTLFSRMFSEHGRIRTEEYLLWCPCIQNFLHQ